MVKAEDHPNLKKQINGKISQYKNQVVPLLSKALGGHREKEDGHRKDAKEPDMTEETEQFIFLSDDPVTEDAFGTHERIAKNIAKKVNSKTVGKAIGLEGTWGSGKSSIIKMLEEKWKDSEDIHLFTFDAWGHQGDSLRRAFLEDFIGSFQESIVRREWLLECTTPEKEKKCSHCKKRKGCSERILNELKQRSENNTVVTTPSITIFGIWIVMAMLIFLPIGLALLSATTSLGDKVSWSGIIAILFSLLISQSSHKSVNSTLQPDLL